MQSTITTNSQRDSIGLHQRSLFNVQMLSQLSNIYSVAILSSTLKLSRRLLCNLYNVPAAIVSSPSQLKLNSFAYPTCAKCRVALLSSNSSRFCGLFFKPQPNASVLRYVTQPTSDRCLSGLSILDHRLTNCSLGICIQIRRPQSVDVSWPGWESVI
jgi:hypothetical protein